MTESSKGVVAFSDVTFSLVQRGYGRVKLRIVWQWCGREKYVRVVV